MPNPTQTRRRPAPFVLAATTTAALAFLLRRFPPDQFPFYPLCPIHRYTGLLCPGCGATRALAALLHGDLARAWHSNALLLLLLPVGFLYALTSCHRAIARNHVPWPALPAPVLYAIFAAVGIFTLLRNLP